jgi:hypothetical protein
MNKLLSAIKAAVQGEPWASANLLNLTVVEQDVALAGNEIDAAHRLVTLVLKARHDANVFGKDLVEGTVLLAAVERARQHQDTATQRLEKAARDFAAFASDVAKDRRGERVVSRLKELHARLKELDEVLRKLPSFQVDSPKKAEKRWTIKSILKKAREHGLRISKSQKDGHFAVHRAQGSGMHLWPDGSATRTDIPAERALKVSLHVAAGFLFPDER